MPGRFRSISKTPTGSYGRYVILTPERATQALDELKATIGCARCRDGILIVRTSIYRLLLILGAMALGSSAFAAGIDSQAYTCANLQGLIAAKGFIFINNANFGDFVVSSPTYCSGEGAGTVPLQRRSVPTTDNPECLVNYCPPGGGGGM